jgi:hypothetical protein
VANHEQNRLQFESAVIERMGAMFPAGTTAEQLRSALLQRGPDGDYADPQRAGEWWAWQTASRTTLHVEAGGICDGAQVLGAYTDPDTAERVKQAACKAMRWEGVAVTVVVVDEVPRELQAALNELDSQQAKA